MTTVNMITQTKLTNHRAEQEQYMPTFKKVSKFPKSSIASELCFVWEILFVLFNVTVFPVNLEHLIWDALNQA